MAAENFNNSLMLCVFRVGQPLCVKQCCDACVRPSVSLSVRPIAQNVAFWGYGHYRTLIGSQAMLEVKPTVSVATRPPEVAKTAGAYRFVAIWAIPFNQLSFCHLVGHSEV